MKRSELVEKTEILLFDILQELIRLNYTIEGLRSSFIGEVGGVPKPIEDNKCKHCNATHENKGQVLACARKNKKKG